VSKLPVQLGPPLFIFNPRRERSDRFFSFVIPASRVRSQSVALFCRSRERAAAATRTLSIVFVRRRYRAASSPSSSRIGVPVESFALLLRRRDASHGVVVLRRRRARRPVATASRGCSKLDSIEELKCCRQQMLQPSRGAAKGNLI